MMHSHALASTRKSAGYFHRNGFLSQLMSVLLAWTMVMSSLPVYATDQPRAEWVHSLDVNSVTTPLTEPAQHRVDPATSARPAIARTVASPRLATSATVAVLHAPALPGNLTGGQGSGLFLNAFSGGLFALPLQAPEPWLAFRAAHLTLGGYAGGTEARSAPLDIATGQFVYTKTIPESQRPFAGQATQVRSKENYFFSPLNAASLPSGSCIAGSGGVVSAQSIPLVLLPAAPEKRSLWNQSTSETDAISE